jgi:hypothetical protein
MIMHFILVYEVYRKISSYHYPTGLADLMLFTFGTRIPV